MRILFVRKYNPFFESGASSNRFCGLIEGLRQCGNTVDLAIVGGYVKVNEKIHLQNGVYYLSHANHYSYWSTRLNNYLFDRLHMRIACRKFNKVDYNSYDVIWITKDQDVLDIISTYRTRLKAKIFIELNEFNDFYINANYNYLQRRKSRRASDKFLSVVNQIDLFAVMTNTLVDYYKKIANQSAKFIHLPMTVDLSRFKDVQVYNQQYSPYIAFCGSIDKSKDGVDILIKAFTKVSHKYPRVKLVLAGFYTYDTPDILKLIIQYNMSDRIKYIGPVDKNSIPSFLSSASVLVLSRPDSHQAQGGFPTKLGEYLATGNPVCVTRVGEIPLYLDDNVSAFMAVPGDVDSFADALDRALSNPIHSKMVGTKGKYLAESVFNSQIQATRLSDFLRQCI